MATSKVALPSQVVSNPTHYRRFNVEDELTRAVRCDASMCDVCDHGRLLYMAASDLLDLMKAHEKRERRIRAARRRGNLVIFPMASR